MYFDIPDEFLIKADSETTLGKIDLEISMSNILKKMSIVMNVNTFNNRKALESIGDFQNDLVYLHSLANSCTKILVDKRFNSIFDETSKFSNLALLILDREDEDGYVKVDANQLFEIVNAPGDIYFFYDKNNNLKKIRIELQDDVSVDFQVNSFITKSFKDSDFRIPREWKCDKVKPKLASDIRTEDLIGDGLVQLQELLKNFNNLDAASLLQEQIRKTILDNSP